MSTLSVARLTPGSAVIIFGLDIVLWATVASRGAAAVEVALRGSVPAFYLRSYSLLTLRPTPGQLTPPRADPQTSMLGISEGKEVAVEVLVDRVEEGLGCKIVSISVIDMCDVEY